MSKNSTKPLRIEICESVIHGYELAVGHIRNGYRFDPDNMPTHFVQTNQVLIVLILDEAK